MEYRVYIHTTCQIADFVLWLYYYHPCCFSKQLFVNLIITLIQFTIISPLCLNSLFLLYLLGISCVCALSWNHVCRGKAVNITYSDYYVSILSYPTINARAPYCYAGPLLQYSILPPYILIDRIFEEKLLTVFMFRFVSQRLSETFLIQRELSEI
jgi:hypothetical protein